jgi:23S rRNA (cytidine1920-2'-O)/16S rRNA (cytidine1409-2'-O)-methyltransferase
MAKTRLDVALVERGLADTRAAAQRLVMAGLVFSNERRLDKAGQSVAADTPLDVRGQPHPYVSRGGLKLEKALDHFAISAQGRIALDVGSSTGGFTDCLLQRGATKVYAVDVGTNQLAWKLRSDPRVISMEKTNIRAVTRVEIPEPAWLAGQPGWRVLGVTESPITGADGNQEFLIAGVVGC